MRLRDLEDGRRLRDMADLELDTCFFNRLQGLLELRELALRVCLVLAVRHREVGEHALDLDVRQRFDRRGQRADLLRADADAAHARLDLEMDLRRLVLAHRLARDGLRERQLADDLRDIVVDDIARLIRQYESEEQDWHREARLAQLNGLAERRDREIRGPRLHRDARDSKSTVAVGIRLDDGTELRPAANILLDLLVIMSKGRKINLRPGRTIWHTNPLFSHLVKFSSQFTTRHRKVKHRYGNKKGLRRSGGLLFVMEIC